MYVAGIPNNIGVDKITNVTFIAISSGTPVSNANITLSGMASGSGATDPDGMLILAVNATAGGLINVTASKSGYKNSMSFITATPALAVSATPASITSGTPAYVTLSVTGAGKPADGAAVRLSGAGIALDGMTNSNGQIIMQVNAPNTGTIVATAKKTAYTEGSTTITSTGQQMLSISSSHTAVAVSAPVYVTFTVTASGTPVGNARVSLSGTASGNGITNQDGRAIIYFTPQSAGTITVSASGNGYAGGSTAITSTGAQSLSIATNPTTVTAGVPSYVLFTVTSGNNAVSEATVTLTGAASAAGITNQNGQVILQVNSTGSGTITASAGKAGFSAASTALSAVGQQTLGVRASPSNITNGVPSYVTITVTSGSYAVSGAAVSVSGGGISAEGVTNSAGRVTLLLNAAGSGTINVVARKTGYIDGLTTLAH